MRESMWHFSYVGKHRDWRSLLVLKPSKGAGGARSSADGRWEAQHWVEARIFEVQSARERGRDRERGSSDK